MKIDINQHKISIGDKYRIYINGQENYKASAELFRLLSVIDLYELDNAQVQMKIKKKWSWWGAKYDLLRFDNNVFRFQSVSVWRITYQCRVGNDTYDIYGHRGRKHSIFKNGTQIGWWDKELVTWFDGDNYTIMANDNCDKELLISFCIAIDNYAAKDSDKGGNAVSFSFGNLGFGARRFDTNWRPL